MTNNDGNRYIRQIKEECVSTNSKNLPNHYTDTFQLTHCKSENSFKSDESHSEVVIEYSGINGVFIKTEKEPRDDIFEDEDLDDMPEDEDPLYTMDASGETIIKTEEDLDTFDFSTLHDNSEDFSSDECSTDCSKYQIINGGKSGADNAKLLFSCESCSFKSTTKISFDRHILAHSRDISDTGHFSASKKNSIPSVLAARGGWRKSAGKSTSSVTKYTGIKFYYCKLCPFRTNVRRRLTLHKLTHTNGPKAMCCGRCSFQTMQVDALKKHMADNHCGDKRFVCTRCNFRTNVKQSLRNHHSLQHSGMKIYRTFTCKYCSFSTRFPTVINYHYLSHAGDNPYLCEVCPFKTDTKDKLDKHQVIHENERIYSCSSCSYKTNAMSELNTHKSKHNGIFCCNICTYSTSDSNKLNRHSHTHLDEALVCNICNYVSPKRYGLINHIRNVHSGDVGPKESGLMLRKSPRNVSGRVNMREILDDEED